VPSALQNSRRLGAKQVAAAQMLESLGRVFCSSFSAKGSWEFSSKHRRPLSAFFENLAILFSSEYGVLAASLRKNGVEGRERDGVGGETRRV
jgi:hypothetical protein